MESTRELTDECKRLYTIAEGIERLDIFYAKQQVDLCLNKLTEEFSKDYYDEEMVKQLKHECDKSAIYLEYVLSIHNTELRNRYLERVEIAELYSKVNSVIKSSLVDKEILGNMCCNLVLCKGLLEKAQQLVFRLTDEDKEVVELIHKQLTAYNKLHCFIER